MRITVRENRKSESWDEIADLLRKRGYTPAEDTDGLCAYLSLKTGIDTPEEVTVVAKYYDNGEFDTEVVAGTYGWNVKQGHANDLAYTYISNEVQDVDVKRAGQCLRSAEKAAGLYVRALQEIKNG